MEIALGIIIEMKNKGLSPEFKLTMQQCRIHC